MTYQDLLRGSLFQVLAARSALEASRLLTRLRPRAVLLHLDVDDEAAWELLARLKQDDGSEPTRVLATVREEDRAKALALGADRCLTAAPGRDELLDALRSLGGGPTARRVLVIDDDAVGRYLLKSFLRDTACVVTEATGGREGLEAARRERPDVIFCDLYMPDMGGLEVLSELKADPATQDIPVVLNTAKSLSPEERLDLERRGVAVLHKDRFSRADAAAEVRRILVQSGIDT
jgi:CheY-like chemotaxis protein